MKVHSTVEEFAVTGWWTNPSPQKVINSTEGFTDVDEIILRFDLHSCIKKFMETEAAISIQMCVAIFRTCTIRVTFLHFTFTWLFFFWLSRLSKKVSLWSFAFDSLFHLGIFNISICCRPGLIVIFFMQTVKQIRSKSSRIYKKGRECAFFWLHLII